MAGTEQDNLVENRTQRRRQRRSRFVVGRVQGCPESTHPSPGPVDRSGAASELTDRGGPQALEIVVVTPTAQQIGERFFGEVVQGHR